MDFALDARFIPRLDFALDARLRTMADIDEIIDNAASSIGYPMLKLEQKSVLKAFVEGRDVFVCLPTGYGKSLCTASTRF